MLRQNLIYGKNFSKKKGKLGLKKDSLVFMHYVTFFSCNKLFYIRLLFFIPFISTQNHFLNTFVLFELSVWEPPHVSQQEKIEARFKKKKDLESPYKSIEEIPKLPYFQYDDYNHYWFFNFTDEFGNMIDISKMEVDISMASPHT